MKGGIYQLPPVICFLILQAGNEMITKKVVKM
jgi:hypothetical protein